MKSDGRQCQQCDIGNTNNGYGKISVSSRAGTDGLQRTIVRKRAKGKDMVSQTTNPRDGNARRVLGLVFER